MPKKYSAIFVIKMNLMKVILNTGTGFNFLESESLYCIEKSLNNNGYRIISSEGDGLIKKYERPAANNNRKSSFCIYLYKDKVLVQRYY